MFVQVQTSFLLLYCEFESQVTVVLSELSSISEMHSVKISFVFATAVVIEAVWLVGNAYLQYCRCLRLQIAAVGN